MVLSKYFFKIMLLLLVSGGVSAAEVDYSLGARVGSYDNLNLIQNPTKGEISQSIRGSVNVSENTANLVANFDASLEAINYRNNQAENENLGDLIANVLWTISPGRYAWYVSDVYTQTLTDSFGLNTPSNRVNTNAFSTGPNFIFRVNSGNNVNLEARVETVSFESVRTVSDSDNDRIDIATSWNHQLRAESSLSLNYVVETVDYDDEVSNSSFDRSDVFIALNYQRGLNVFEADFGVIHIDNKNAIDVDESRFRLSVLNSRTRTTSIRLEINRDITDTSNELLSQELDPLFDEGTEATVSDIFLEETARIIYNKTLVSGSLALNLNKTISDYQQLDQLDQIEKGLLLNSTWDVQRASQLMLEARYTNTVFNNISREDDEYVYDLLYTYNARRHITIGFEAISQKRKSSDVVNDYDDFRFFLSLTYSTR